MLAVFLNSATGLMHGCPDGRRPVRQRADAVGTVQALSTVRLPGQRRLPRALRRSAALLKAGAERGTIMQEPDAGRLAARFPAKLEHAVQPVASGAAKGPAIRGRCQAARVLTRRP